MSSELSRLERLLARVTHTANRLLVGESLLEMNQAFVHTLSPLDYVRHLRQGTRTIRRLTVRYGAVDAQMLIGLSAMWNGCGLCGFGHVLTGDLLSFRDEGILHPLHPHVIAQLMDMEDHEGIEEIERRLAAPRFERLRRLARRMFELEIEEAAPNRPGDALLESAILVWTWTVQCTIPIGLYMRPEEAVVLGHGIGRDKALRRRYEQARARERAAGPR